MSRIGKVVLSRVFPVLALAALMSSGLDALPQAETAGRRDAVRLSRPLRSSGDPGIRDMPVVRR